MKKDFKVKKKKLIAFIILDFITLFSFTFVFYGPWSGFRNFWITSSMTTMNHKYLARWFYTDKAINKKTDYIRRKSTINLEQLYELKLKNVRKVYIKYYNFIL